MNFRKAVYIGFLCLLLLPLSNYYLKYFHSADLHGWTPEVNKPELSLQGLSSGEFQNAYETWYKKKTGFSNNFTRLRNQIYYSLLGISMNSEIVVGKQGYIFEKAYITNGVYGHDQISLDTIDLRAKKIKLLQDTLKKEGKDLIVILAPGKGSYCEEFIPKKYLSLEKKTTNYTLYQQSFKQAGVNYMDMKKWFLEMKDTVSYPLFTKYGVHWNKYGAVKAIDSLVSYYKGLFPNLPDFKVDYSIVNRKNWYNEADGFENINTIFPPRYEKLIHPEYSYVAKSEVARPKLIAVADSYFWSMHAFGFGYDYFDNSEYWYYNDMVYMKEKYQERKINYEDFDFEQRVSSADCFLLLFTEINLKEFDRGFIDRLYSYYFNDK